MTESSPVDLAAALRQVDGDKELLVELVQAFLEDAPVRMRALRSALAAGDGPAVAREAHPLRGTLRIVGAQRAAALANEVETAGSVGDLARASVQSGALVEEMDDVLRVLSDPGWQSGL